MIDIDIHNVTSIAYNVGNYPEVVAALETVMPGFQYTYAYKRGFSNGKINLFKGEEFPTGLINYLLIKIEEAGVPVSVTDYRTIRHIDLQPTTVQLRPYQEEIVNKALTNLYSDGQGGGTWWPRGVIQVATGGGKTEMAAAMIQMTNVPTIFLVHRQDLATQATERFKPYGIEVGTLEDPKQVVVTTVQSLMSWNMNFEKTYINSEGEEVDRSDEWMDKKARRQAAKSSKVKTYLDTVEQVFIDEAHLIASTEDKMNMFSTALSLMPNAFMRWGLTATPFMRDTLHNWMLEGATGPILAQITNRELIDLGYLSEAFVDIYIMPQNKDIPKDWPRSYEYGIMTYKLRNDKIVQCFSTYPGPTMILVNKIGHGQILEKKLAEAGFTVPFVYGNSSKEERRAVIAKVKSGKLPGVIASTIWDEGIDIANIQTVILAGAGKSEIKNLQRLGRGLRVSSGKSALHLIDFLDSSPTTLKKHSQVRELLWQEQGFTIRYLQ